MARLEWNGKIATFHGSANRRSRVKLFPILAFLLLLLSGCFWGAGARLVVAEKVGPGHCQHQGVMDVQILGFNRTRDATLYVRLENLFDGHLSYGPHVFIDTIDDVVAYTGLLRNESWPLIPHERLEEGQAVTEAVKLGEVVNATWKELSFYYTYSAAGSRNDHASNFLCSLVGDNAPWAFENGNV